MLGLLLSGDTVGEEEGRAVVAECLGRLALLAPAPVLAAVQKHAGDDNASMRTVVGGGWGCVRCAECVPISMCCGHRMLVQQRLRLRMAA